MFLARARLLKRIDAERVRQAIAAAEHQTSVRVRVSLAPFFWGDVRKAAERAFTRLGRHGVLILVVPSRRKFVVLGDEDIHAKVGQEFWGDFTGGLLHGIDTIGSELAPSLPYDAATDTGEGPDEIDVG